MEKIALLLKKWRLTLILTLILIFHLYNVRNQLFDNKLDESWYVSVQSKFSSMMKGESLNVENLVFDPELYALAGWLYVHGVPPSDFNFEHPPLAKYFIGFSEVLFQSPTAANTLFSLATLLVVYLLSIKLFGKTAFALIPVYALSLEKLFLSEARSSMLDIYSTFFISLSVLIFLYAIKAPKLFPVLSIVIGLGIACKWESGLIVFAFIAFLLLDKAWRKLGYFIASLSLAFLVYTGSYLNYFLSGHTFLDFIVLQLSIYKFHSSFPHQGILRIWLLLLAGVIGPETRTTFFIDEESSEITKAVITKGVAITYSYNPLTWTISIFAVFISLLRTFVPSKEYRILPLWFISFTLPMSSTLVLEHHILNFMPSFILSIAHLLKSGWERGEKGKKGALLIAIIVYLGALMIWHYIRIPSFVAI
jgi:predicted membrane-bound dolichyl-phosphate-mannose-protein mannosyltransferase